LHAFLKPGAGGHLYELDVAPKGLNLTDTLSRHREAYHRKVPEARVVTSEDEVKSIHEMVLAKVPDLEQKLHYDWYPRHSLVDHFLADGVSLEQFEQAAYAEVGDFVLGAYDCRAQKGARQARAHLRRHGTVWLDQQPCAVCVEKEVVLDKDRPRLRVRYAIGNNSSRPLRLRFGVEFGFGLRSAGSGACWYYGETPDERLGGLLRQVEWQGRQSLGVADRDNGVNVQLRWEEPATVWAFPINAVSQSEGGFELSYQCSVVMPSWRFELAPGASWRMDVEQTVEVL